MYQNIVNIYLPNRLPDNKAEGPTSADDQGHLRRGIMPNSTCRRRAERRRFARNDLIRRRGKNRSQLRDGTLKHWGLAK